MRYLRVTRVRDVAYVDTVELNMVFFNQDMSFAAYRYRM